MKKRFLLLTLIMCLLGGVNSLSLKAQDDLNVVITGNEKVDYFGPFEPYRHYSYEQTIYLKSEIVDGEGNTKTGTIDKITYYVAEMENLANDQRDLVVYMKEVDDSYFEFYQTLGYENIPVAGTDIVYDKTITVSEGELTIDIKDYKYNGKNLLISVLDVTGSQGEKSMWFTQFSSSIDINNSTFYRTIQVASDDENYESYVGGTYYMDKKTISPKIKLTFAPAPALVSPAHDETIGGTTVDLSWSYGANNTATHYQVLLGTDEKNLSPISGNEQNRWVARTESGTDVFATDDKWTVDDLIYGTTYYWRVDVRNGEGDPVDGTIWSFATPASTEFVFESEGDWNDANNWEGGAVPGNGAIVTLNAAATINAEDNINVADLEIEDGSLTINGSLTITGKFSNTDASKLVINDGGQIFQTNEGVKATFNMIINNPSNWETAQDGWQLISSPFTDASINGFTNVEEGNEYDLYKFDGSKNNEWQNFKYQENEFETEFILTRGYLASYKETGTARITGTLNNATDLYLDKYDKNNKITVTVGGNMHNFFLIGNPFPFDIDMSKMVYRQHLIEGYAILYNNGGNFQYVGTTGTIKAGDAFLIKTTGVDNDSNPILEYSHTPSKSRSENHNSINLIATGAEGSDNLIISLSGAENEGFNKLENFNKDIATLFVVKNDIRYGIANFDNDVTMIDVAFEATKMGNYTIAAQPNGKFETLTLIDRFTGIETNLLVEDYSFTATSNDNYNRFIVKLAVSDQQSAVSDNFVYQSGEELIIDAEGTIQIIDMMGRVVYTSNVENNNRINVSNFNNGAYVVRVINENEVKVQKIIL